MSTLILGADGKPATEEGSAKPEETTRPGSNGKDKTENRDVRTVPMGVLLYNFNLCVVDMHINKLTLGQMMQMMHQQKMVTEPPEIVHIKAAIEHQTMFRDVMVGELNARFKDVDERRLACLNIDVEDRTKENEQ